MYKYLLNFIFTQESILLFQIDIAKTSSNFAYRLILLS